MKQRSNRCSLIDNTRTRNKKNYRSNYNRTFSLEKHSREKNGYNYAPIDILTILPIGQEKLFADFGPFSFNHPSSSEAFL